MKYTYLIMKWFLTVALFALFLTGCTTTEKMVFYSNTPTTISYDVVNKSREVQTVNIDSPSWVKVKIPSDMYLGYIIAKDSDTGLEIPIGLDLHRNSRNTPKALIWLSLPTLAAISLGAIPTIVSCRMEQMSYRYEFSYDSHQQIEIPFLSTTLRYPDPPKSDSSISE